MPTTAQIRQASYGPDQAPYAAACVRGAMRGEVYPITVTTSSKRFLVPDAWKGALVAIFADGADLGYAISTATDATVDLTARAAESAPVASGSVALTAAGNGCGRIASVQSALSAGHRHALARSKSSSTSSSFLTRSCTSAALSSGGCRVTY
jgi:hypothetical protein